MQEDNEIRFVHREETFNDLAVRELAKSRSACVCRLQFGRCVKSDCKKCSISEQYARCYKQMNDYDKIRLSSYFSKYYMHDSLYPGKWMSYKKLKKYLIKWALIVYGSIMLLALPIIILSVPGDEPPHHASSEMNKDIVKTIVLAQKYVWDYNRDGKINCIDYAIGFKVAWDAIFPDNKNDCIIIRNRSLTMNHLFVGVYEGDNIIYIEPWTDNPYIYGMREVWGNKWNPRFNKYDETDYWLGEVCR